MVLLGKFINVRKAIVLFIQRINERDREIERDKDTAGFFRSFEGKRERERESERWYR